MASSEWHGQRDIPDHANAPPLPGERWQAGARPAYTDPSGGRTPPGERWQPQAEYAVRTPPSEKWHASGEFSIPGGAQSPSHAKPRPPPHVLGEPDRPVVSNVCELFLTALAWLLVLAFFPFSMFACVRVVQEYERAIIFRLGRLVPSGAQGPGLFLMLPCLDKFTCVDLRVVSFDVAPQEILTKDLVTISVDAVVYFRIFEPIVSVTNVENSGYSTRLLAATTLRTVLGQYSLADILSQRESIAHLMQGTLDEATDTWGVKVERVEVKDVRLPIELQRAMAAEAEASREAKAKVIAAEGEMKASKALKSAADVMCTSPSALQLRYLQTLGTISAEKNSTIVFPVPIDVIGGFMSQSRAAARPDDRADDRGMRGGDPAAAGREDRAGSGVRVGGRAGSGGAGIGDARGRDSARRSFSPGGNSDAKSPGGRGDCTATPAGLDGDMVAGGGPLGPTLSPVSPV